MRERLGMQPVPVSAEDAEMIRWLGEDVATQMVADLPPDQRDAIRAHVLEDRDYAARADVAALGQTGRLSIYDWERSLLGPRGTEAVSKAEAESRAAERPGARVLRAPSLAPGGWFALDGDPALTNADVDRASAATDPQTLEPVVAIEFTASGRTAFEALTRELARRGKEQAARGPGGLEAAQHFAIVLDDRVVAVPFIDFRQVPDGIDVAAGTHISGGLTPESARRVAALLSAGPLDARLVLESEDPVGG